MTNDWHPGDGAAMFEVCSQFGREGVVAKRLAARYLPGRRTRAWLKQKCPAWVRDYAPRRRRAEWGVDPFCDLGTILSPIDAGPTFIPTTPCDALRPDGTR